MPTDLHTPDPAGDAIPDTPADTGMVDEHAAVVIRAAVDAWRIQADTADPHGISMPAYVVAELRAAGLLSEGPLRGGASGTPDWADYVRRVLAVFAFDGTDSVWWRTDGDMAPGTFFVQCSDFFAWGGADLERIDHADLDALGHAADDVRTAGEEPSSWAGELFAARKRGMRPQRAQYKNIPDVLWDLFDAAGPPRETGLVNPKPQPSRLHPLGRQP